MRPKGAWPRTARLRRQSVMLAAVFCRRHEGRQVMQQDIGIPGRCGARIPGGTNFVRPVASASVGHSALMRLNQIPLSFSELLDQDRASLNH